MSLNQPRLRETRVKMSLRTLDFDARRFLHDPAHPAMLFSLHGVAVLGKTAFQVFCFSDIDQLVLLVVNEVDAGRAGK